MKKTIKRIEFFSILSLFLFSFGINFFPAAAQETQRNRVVVKSAPTPPRTTATPGQTPTPQPTPLGTPMPAPTPVPAQTLPELQEKIRAVLARPELRRGQVGVKIVSLDTGKVLFENNSEKYLMPASNMKNFTISTAFDRLSPDFRFVTSVYAAATPDASGTIHGNLTIYGRGDPSISTAFNDGDYYKGMDALAQKIVQSGVKKIEGDLVGDESYFNSDAIPATWEWNDLQWYYGAEVSALTVNDNSLDLIVRPGASVGASASAQLLPNAYGMILLNRIITTAAGTKRDITVYRRLGSNVLEISGTIPVNLDKYQAEVAAYRPANVFVSMLRGLLEQKGVTITGQTKVVNAHDKMLAPAAAVSQTPPVEITRLESVPLSIIAAKTMEPSQNLYTELILRAIGEQAGDKTDPKKTSEAKGLEVVQNFLAQAGIAPGSVLQYDGCGLSRHDLVTPDSVARLYSYMNAQPYAQSWRDALTIAGVDGTLKNRFVGTPAANNVRGKTGTIDQVSALSGYVTTANGERLAFSVLTNAIPDGKLRTSTIDEIVLMLANF
ncbi:MAG: D-alanyl-D-alanine carboxypeptidase/D-alanyl-D-alanine endopeptidase, partial [Pyrinomonadaceae bacterium]